MVPAWRSLGQGLQALWELFLAALSTAAAAKQKSSILIPSNLIVVWSPFPIVQPQQTSLEATRFGGVFYNSRSDKLSDLTNPPWQPAKFHVRVSLNWLRGKREQKESALFEALLSPWTYLNWAILVDGTSTGSTIHVILSPPQADEESSGWSRLLRFYVACRLLRMTVNGEPLNLGLSLFMKWFFGIGVLFVFP